MTDPTRTIAAISTPPGKGGVALIRISGAEAFAVADRCFQPRIGKTPLSERPRRHAVWGDVTAAGETVDDGIAITYAADHSYTGENMVELCCHGGILVTRMVLEAVLMAGAEPAGPGEFTRRAYTNGRLSLTEAEAIGNLLEATGEAQVRLAARKSRTKLAQTLDGFRDRILSLLSSLYAAIDYPEEDLAELSRADMLTGVRAIRDDMEALCATYRTGRSIQEGIRTVLCGKPNVGKSSLYNLLCRDDTAAIVTEIAGTTRDILEKTVSVGNVTLHLCDTAGLRDTDNPVEQIGVARSRDKLREAELILAVFDASRPLTEEDRDLLKHLQTAHGTVIGILNKSDLPPADLSEVTQALPQTVALSAKDGDLTALEARISDLFTDGTIRVGYDAILSDARQYAALHRALELTGSTEDALRAGFPAEVAAGDLELALGILSELDGRAVSEAIVSEIFSHFCVGK